MVGMKQAAQAVRNWGQIGGYLGKGALTGRYGSTVAGAAYGGLAGAGYGMLSGNTSVMGGAMMGAGLGAGGRRYGGAARKSYLRGRAANQTGLQLAQRSGMAAFGRMKGDVFKGMNLGSKLYSNASISMSAIKKAAFSGTGAKVGSNQGVNPIRSSSKIIKRGTHPMATVGPALKSPGRAPRGIRRQRLSDRGKIIKGRDVNRRMAEIADQRARMASWGM
jgi:hypothetical protein